MKIALRDVCFAYPNGKQVFRGLSLDLQSGGVLSVLGPNGAGKSTLLGCVARLYIPSSGKIVFDDRDYLSLSYSEVARRVGFVPQTTVPSFDYSVLDYVVTGCAPRMRPFQKPEKAEYDVALAAIESLSLGYLTERSMLKISGGERQMVTIARVLTQRPDFILLDEPTAHLDIKNQVKVLRALKGLAKKGFGIVMSTHNPDHVFLLGGQVATMNPDGTFSSGLAQDVLNEGLLQTLYDRRLKVVRPEGFDRNIAALSGIE